MKTYHFCLRALQFTGTSAFWESPERVFFYCRLFSKHAQMSRMDTLEVSFPDTLVMSFLYPLINFVIFEAEPNEPLKQFLQDRLAKLLGQNSNTEDAQKRGKKNSRIFKDKTLL